MSEALYEFGGLRFWSEEEIEQREAFIRRMAFVVKDTLTQINSAWTFWRVEGPGLTPAKFISSAYTSDDVFVTNHVAGEQAIALRAETTHSSYTYAEWLMQRDKRARLPICVWQAGKSFRRETNDGASAAKMRYNEFWQLEFQALYRADSGADYQGGVINAARNEIERFTGKDSRVVASDRLPSYSKITQDIEVNLNHEAFLPPPSSNGHEDVWREMASCSLRTDYATKTHPAGAVTVLELAIGLDRIVEASK